MTNTERRDAGMLYQMDAQLWREQARARRLTQRLNTMDRADFPGLQRVAAELLGRDDVWINPPFYCDYGSRISVGRNFYANYNCTILDVGRVVLGDNCLLAPNVSIYTAGHPVHPASRNTHYEYGADVVIGDNVWIGGNSVVCPGVRIGGNTVIGAGSVVTRDVPEWCVAAGNPCRVIRPVTEADRERFHHGRTIDPAALRHMRELWQANPGPHYPTALPRER